MNESETSQIPAAAESQPTQDAPASPTDGSTQEKTQESAPAPEAVAVETKIHEMVTVVFTLGSDGTAGLMAVRSSTPGSPVLGPRAVTLEEAGSKVRDLLDEYRIMLKETRESRRSCAPRRIPNTTPRAKPTPKPATAPPPPKPKAQLNLLSD